MIIFKKKIGNRVIVDFYFKNIVLASGVYRLTFFNIEFNNNPLVYGFEFTFFNLTFAVNYFKIFNYVQKRRRSSS